ncbi:helix-turn-helix transcriptional regulator [Streptomyces albus]|uniref:helix-turn-helix transcriptional regulator n=1 Tax=Streptomyces albus TaxID=1888 RepID=UPI0033EBCD0A
MNATVPGPLTSGILTRDDLRRALQEHDFAAAFACIKKWGGLSQNRIASACQLTPGKVSAIINGQHQITSMEVIRRIADGLRIPGAFLGLAPRPWESVQPERRLDKAPDERQPTDDEVPWQPDVTVALAEKLTRSDLVMDRRDASRALAAAAVTGTSLLDPLEAWLQPAALSSRSRRIGRLGIKDVEQLEQTAQAFRRWDHQHGGGLRRKAVLGQLSEVAAALDEHQTTTVESRLYRVMAHLSGTAATMAWDTGYQRRAQDYYRLALRSAHAAEDVVFGANVLAGMARQMLSREQPQDALELVRLAQEGSRRVAGPRVRAMLHTREAWALAAMGRTAAFNRATERARDALSESSSDDEEPYWIAYFDEAELAGVTGGRLLDLARRDRAHAEEAADHICQALAHRGPEAARSHALDRIGLAECHFLAGDITGAVEETHRAADAAMQTASVRVRDQLGGLYSYTVGHSKTRAVRGARDRLRDLLVNR